MSDWWEEAFFKADDGNVALVVDGYVHPLVCPASLSILEFEANVRRAVSTGMFEFAVGARARTATTYKGEPLHWERKIVEDSLWIQLRDHVEVCTHCKYKHPCKALKGLVAETWVFKP